MLDFEVSSGHDPESEGLRAAGVALPLTDPRAAHAPLTGGKAAALARAAGAGLPVLPGFVVLPLGPSVPAVPAGPGADGSAAVLRRAWRELSRDGARPLVVRSSSAAEDTAESSMAGQFTSVLDVSGWEAFGAALRTVRASAERLGSEAAMAVLVQPMVRARLGGVLFGADPVAGRTDRFLVSVVRGGPDSLVSGTQQGTSFHLSPHGRLEPGAAPQIIGELLSAAELRRLATLARRAAHVFGGPQDIEFGFDERTGTLWLFQSRPITAMAPRPARRARLLGPGPVAETLPGVLQPLEEDLWVAPMAHGLATALDLAGAAPRTRLREVPVVSTVEGRAVADLTLLGVAPRRHRLLAALNPLPPMRRLAAAWRVGRLHGTLPQLAAALVADVDRELAEVPPPTELSAAGLIAALRWSRGTLLSLHAQEALAGAVFGPGRVGQARVPESGTGSGTAAASALAALHHGRAEGLDDAQIVAARPEVLALVAPSLTAPLRLPAQGLAGSGPGTGSLGPREALRLRVRWVQEFQVRLVREVAYRIAARDGLDGPEPERLARIALLRWPELVAAAEGGPLPTDLGQRQPRSDGAPLPDAFRLAEGGLVVAEPTAGDGGTGAAAVPPGGGQGVSGGHVSGVVWDGTGPRPAAAVLVVRTLDPALAPLLPQLTALVAQTGSPLSHLAVLARELRLPTVTGASGAADRYPPGTRVVVDGSTGEIAALPATPDADTTRAPGERPAPRLTSEARS